MTETERLAACPWCQAPLTIRGGKANRRAPVSGWMPIETANPTHGMQAIVGRANSYGKVRPDPTHYQPLPLPPPSSREG